MSDPDNYRPLSVPDVDFGGTFGGAYRRPDLLDRLLRENPEIEEQLRDERRGR